MKTSLLLAAFLLAASVQAQQPGWTNYTYARNIAAMAAEANYIWAATEGGLVRLNTITKEREFFNKANSGLPSNSITAIAVDKKGNKWIGTSNGLVKYNGQSWSRQSTQSIRSLTVDSSDNIWYVTSSTTTLYDLHRISDTEDPDFMALLDSTLNDVFRSSLRYFLSLITDREGKVWFTVINYRGENVLIEYSHDAFTYHEGMRVRASYVDQKNRLLFMTDAHSQPRHFLVIYDKGKWEVMDSTKGFPSYILAICEDEDGRLHLLTNSGLYIYRENKLERHLDLGIYKNPLSHSLIRDNNGTMWVGTAEFIKIADTVTRYSASNSPLSYRINNLAFQRSDSGLVTWIATDKGLVRLRNGEWLRLDTTNSPLNGLEIIDAVVDQSNALWVSCTADSGNRSFFKFDGKQWIDYSSFAYSKNTGRLIADLDGSIWMNSIDLRRFDGTGTTIYNQNNINLPMEFIWAMRGTRGYVDKNGTKWFTVYNKLVSFDNKTWRVHTPPDWIGGVETNPAFYNGKIWVACWKKEHDPTVTKLVEYDGQTWTTLIPVLGHKVSQINLDSAGNAWLYYNNFDMKPQWFVNHIIRTNGKDITTYSIDDIPLPNNIIKVCTFDPSGNMWVGCSYSDLHDIEHGGIAVYTGTATSVDDQPGIPSARSSLSQAFPNPAGDFTTISYSVPENISGEAPVGISLFDPMGREIALLASGTRSPGNYSERVDLSGLQSGVYFYRIRIGNTMETRQIVVAR